MTAQASDNFQLDGVRHSIVAIQNTWPFEPGSHGFSPVAPHTACWRGFVATYELAGERLHLSSLAVGFGAAAPHVWNGISPEGGEYFKFDRMWSYRDVRLPIPYTGGLVIASDFLREFYVHMGFHRPHCYRLVKELIFDDGRLVTQYDHSQRMESARERIRASAARPPADPVSRADVDSFVRSEFSLNYEDKWML